MAPKNTGKEYEVFVANLQQALLDSEPFMKQKNIAVEPNKELIDNCGIKREFDVYWEYELGGITYKTVIECKDYKSSVSVEKIDALLGKLHDLPDIRGVFATKKEYQSGAKTKAEKNKIDLLIFREQNGTDWKDKNGNPYIKKMEINLELQMPARIISFDPLIDGNWVKENTDIDISKPLQFSEITDRIIIEDIEKSEKYSLFDLEGKLFILQKGNSGTFESTEKFKDAFISYGDKKLKLNGYKVEYAIGRPVKRLICIDYSKELMGVIEYLSKGVKKAVFKKGIIREEQI